MSKDQSNHELYHEADRSELEYPRIQTAFEESQRIEGGGPLKKVNFKSLPVPIRIFAYICLVILITMGVFSFFSGLID